MVDCNVNGREDRPRVIVVGGGVSGCACAAQLAVKGVGVTVVSSALDVIGLPGYGPEVWPGEGGWSELEQVFGSLPEPLRCAWLNASLAPASGEPVLIVDRRAVSVETKRALEQISGLEFRQALITDLRLRADWRVEVESAFAEVFVADAVVLAPGLALKGRVEVGAETLEGGRYGEVPANDLLRVLMELGVQLTEVEVDVGLYCAHDSREITRLFGSEVLSVQPSPAEWAVAANNDHDGHAQRPFRDDEHVQRQAEADEADEVRDGGIALPGGESMSVLTPAHLSGHEMSAARCRDGYGWPAGFPRAPHWCEELRPKVALLGGNRPRGGQGSQADGCCQDAALVSVVPDGAATAEFYVDHPCSAGGKVSLDVTRMHYRVRALVAGGVDEMGRIPGLSAAVRIVGRAAGAQNYLSSLRTGVAAAEDLTESLMGALRERDLSAEDEEV